MLGRQTQFYETKEKKGAKDNAYIDL
jgi:hypothetical protein